MDVFFKTTDMMVPSLLYAQLPNEDKVAVSFSVAPTFDPLEPQENPVWRNEEATPEQIKLYDGSRFHFIFIVDRSGSMRGMRNKMAREALQLFIRSLPRNCLFSIISFGDRYDVMQIGENKDTCAPYNEHSKEFAVAEVK